MVKNCVDTNVTVLFLMYMVYEDSYQSKCVGIGTKLIKYYF